MPFTTQHINFNSLSIKISQAADISNEIKFIFNSDPIK